MRNANHKRRDQLSIIANVLENAGEGVRKTHIMYRSNLSFEQLNDYLSFMVDNGLIRQSIVGHREVYIVTIKGMLFALMYRELISMITTQNEKKRPSK